MCVCVCMWTHGLVFDGGAGHTQVEFPVLLQTSFDQCLN